MHDFCFCASRYDVTSRHKAVTCVFHDCVGLTGDKAFVDLDTAFDNDRIRANLVSRLQYRNVVHNDVFHGDFLFFPVADNPDFRGGNKRQFIHRVLCAKFLHDTDKRIADAQYHETVIAHAVLVESRKRRDDDCHHEKHEVEKREGVVDKYSEYAFGFYCLQSVDEPALDARFDFFGRESRYEIAVGVFDFFHTFHVALN